MKINLDTLIQFTDLKKRLNYATSKDSQLLAAITANCQFFPAQYHFVSCYIVTVFLLLRMQNSFKT